MAKGFKCLGACLFLVMALSCASGPAGVPQAGTPKTLPDFERISGQEILGDLEGYFKILEWGFREGRGLTAQELTYARTLGIRDPEGIRVLELDRIPLVLERDKEQVRKLGQDPQTFDPNGVAFPRTIMLKKNNADRAESLVHELVHIRQSQTLGFLKMDAQANFEYQTYGYEDSPLEIEARTRAWELLEK